MVQTVFMLNSMHANAIAALSAQVKKAKSQYSDLQLSEVVECKNLRLHHRDGNLYAEPNSEQGEVLHPDRSAADRHPQLSRTGGELRSGAEFPAGSHDQHSSGTSRQRAGAAEDASA